MTRKIVVLAGLVVLLGAIATTVHPTITQAMQAGLPGRTHMIVREDGLKVLSASLTGGSNPTQTLVLKEHFRDGTLGQSDYTVPSGRVFVMTDIRVKYIRENQNVGVRFVDVSVGSNGAVRYPFRINFPDGAVIMLGVIGHHRLTGGVAFDPGANIEVTILGVGFADYEVTVLGYETEDV